MILCVADAYSRNQILPIEDPDPKFSPVHIHLPNYERQIVVVVTLTFKDSPLAILSTIVPILTGASSTLLHEFTFKNIYSLFRSVVHAIFRPFLYPLLLATLWSVRGNPWANDISSGRSSNIVS